MIQAIKLLDFQEQPAIVMRATIPVEKMPEFFGKAFGGVINFLSESGQTPAGMPFAAYFNLDMRAMQVEGGFPVSSKMEGNTEIISNLIPAGQYLTTIFEGPYNDLKIAYDALIDYAKQNNLQPTGVVYEYYLNDPTENPLTIPMTEIRFHLK